ncbi:MAG: hypothetical protein WA004_00275 [Saprospiraceae bacterium]
MSYLLPILALTFLCAIWMAVQLLARRVGTKNHIDEFKNGCGGCTCGGGHCERE